MKLQDASIAFADVVPTRRRLRAEEIGSRFRLGLDGLECGSQASPETRTALIGASAWSLKTERIEETVEIIGLVGGLLCDIGLTVCPVGADVPTHRPDLIVWVCGDETRADEYEQLVRIGSRGIAIGSCVEGLDDWDAIELDVLHARTAFIDEFADAVASQLDGS